MATRSELGNTVSAIQFRDELLKRGWPDAHRVAELAGKTLGPEAATYAIRARASEGLLGVWSAACHCFLYPDFQFHGSGAIRKDVARLLAVLPGKDDRGGWRRAFWLYLPHVLLGNRTPAEVFIDEPGRVINVAREEFLSDCEASW